MIWTRVLAWKATELLHAGTAEALPKNCSVWSRPKLLLSLQTGYCISHDTVAVCTHTVMRACSASKNTLFNLSVHSSGVLSEQNQLQWALSVVQHPFSTQTYPRATALRCQTQGCANAQSLHPPVCQMPARPGSAHLKHKESESSLQLPRVSTWLMGPPSSKWACLLAHSFCRIQLKQAAKTSWPLLQEPAAMLSAASPGSGSAKSSENSLGLPGQFGVSRGPDSLDNLQSSITIYGSLSKPNSESSHSPISNWNTSQNKVCCQVLWGRARQQGEGAGQLGMECWSQALEGRQGAITLPWKHEQTAVSRRKQSIREVVFNKQLWKTQFSCPQRDVNQEELVCGRRE